MASRRKSRPGGSRPSRSGARAGRPTSPGPPCSWRRTTLDSSPDRTSRWTAACWRPGARRRRSWARSTRRRTSAASDRRWRGATGADTVPGACEPRGVTRRRGALRQLIERRQGLVVPGAFDALSARLVEQAGFPAVYMTGFGVSASRLGLPNLGFAGLAEMVDQARNLAAAVSIPLIADADTGYGSALQVRRTVQQYEAAGVAALHIEDQVAPKRCGHLTGKQVVPVEIGRA